MVRQIALIILVVGALSSDAALGASTVLLNESPAHDCYREVLEDHQKPDLTACDLAIEVQKLTNDDLGATYSNRGVLLTRLGRLSDALRDHDRAVEYSGHLSTVFINRSNTLVASRRFAEAMVDLDKAVAMQDEALPVAHYNRSLLFRRLGDLPSARAEAERAAELSPDSVQYAEHLEALRAATAEP